MGNYEIKWNIYEDEKPKRQDRYLTCTVDGRIAINTAEEIDGVVDFFHSRRVSVFKQELNRYGHETVREPSKRIYAWSVLPDVPKELTFKPERELIAEIERLKAELSKYKDGEKE